MRTHKYMESTVGKVQSYICQAASRALPSNKITFDRLTRAPGINARDKFSRIHFLMELGLCHSGSEFITKLVSFLARNLQLDDTTFVCVSAPHKMRGSKSAFPDLPLPHKIRK